MTKYYTGPDGATGFSDSDATMPPGFLEVNKATYDAAVVEQQANAFLPRNSLNLRVSRSSERANSDLLQDSQLDVGKLYAVFILDVPDLNITKVDFYLDAVFHHTEFSAPWDYDGTAFGGGASRVTFTAGTHTIKADITTPTGVITVESVFRVE